MALLITNIGTLSGIGNPSLPLRGQQLRAMNTIENAFMVIEGEEIAAFGSMEETKLRPQDFNQHYDAEGRTILPSWCDSHTHIVFAGSRETEFVDKIRGHSYAEIAAKGGGILNSARKLNATSEDELYRQSAARLQELIRLGTGAIEIKSGYGLTVEGELKMLRVIQRLKRNFRLLIKATFLGAHTIPEVYKANREGYIRLIVDEMIPKVADQNLADYIDVFCETNFFSPAETEAICNAGLRFGLKPKIHANQLHVSGGVQAGIRCKAISVDHLESMDQPAIEALANASTIGTLLPSAAFFLRMTMQPARELINAGCAIALASDFNPGSSPSGNMNFVVALSCIQMKMLPEEAINAATINGAFAMELASSAGSICEGKFANLIVCKPMPSLAFLPYSFGSNLIERVLLKGEWV